MTMEPSLLSIQFLVHEVKKEIFSDDNNFHEFVSPSAYDTAWLAMIPHCESENGPMFESCLNWVLENQREGGFWGEINEDDDSPSIDTLPATLACLLALKKWNIGHEYVEKGLEFIHSNMETILDINYQDLPRWFILAFPAMIELCEAAGLNLVFRHELKGAVTDIFVKRQQILDMEELVDESPYFPPLLSYLETFPSTYHFDRQVIVKHVNKDGSLFQSPSATACAFLTTKNVDCIKYLQSLVRMFPNGVPSKYPMDEEVIKLCMVDHVQRLGLAEHFTQEIDQILARVYRNQKDYKSNPNEAKNVSIKLFKDALAFRLLRMQGHYVNPESFCWFLHDAEILTYMEENYEQFISAMYSVYRATDLLFPGENVLQQARTFARKVLQNYNTRIRDHNFVISKGLQNVINHELNVPWIARLDRLYHRKWIEENNNPLWIGKASFYRLSCLVNEKLMQLAPTNYELRQSIYQHELEELKRWSKKWRLSEMGFGREKTTYTYFAVVASACLPFDSNMRLAIAKAAIIVTVSDDFYDMEGSSSELEDLTNAIRRWDCKGLKGHGKTIFDALDDLVNYIASEYHPLEENRAMAQLRHMWRETFFAWMVEKTWSVTGYVPSMDEYLETGMISIAAHTVTLPATSFLSQSSKNGTLKPFEYHHITKLLMIIARLLNDTQSYQKEQADGKMNLVMLYLNQNPNIGIEDSIAYVKEILEVKRKEFLEHVLTGNDMPKSCKEIHLSCMKVFQMFFNSGNLFDSETALVDDINKTIYLPIRHRTKSKSEPLLKPSPSVPPNKQKKEIYKSIHPNLKIQVSTSLIKQRSVKNFSAFPKGGKLLVPVTFNMCFV